jgi:4-aminobutyrate aminotransferase / (S)-3-amino-2-methylpropionate transaminase / 5-aminovalerate transaminase
MRGEAMVAIELLVGDDLARPDAPLAENLVRIADNKGILKCGNYANVIRVMVPLTWPDTIVGESMRIFGESFVEPFAAE